MRRNIVLPCLACANLIISSFCIAQQKVEGHTMRDSSAWGKTKNTLDNVGGNKAGLQAEWSSVKKSLLDINGITGPIVSKVRLLQGRPKLKISNIDLAAGYSYIHDTTAVAKGMYRQMQGIYNYGANLDVAFAAVPFKGSLNGNNGVYVYSATKLNDLYQFNFDPQAYKETLRQEVMQKIKPEIVLGAVLRRVNDIKDNYERGLRTELEKIQQGFKERHGKHLEIPGGISDLSVKDMAAVRNKLFSHISENGYADDMDRYKNLLQNAGSAFNDSSLRVEALYEADKTEALKKVFEKITVWKEKFDNNPTVKKLQSHLPFTAQNYKAFLNDPAMLSDVIKKYGSLSPVQQIFMNITKLDLGQNPVQNGQFSVNNLMNTGINTAFQDKKMGAGFIAGVNNNPNNWLQGGLSSFVNNEYSSMSGLTLGTGSRSFMNHSVSINLFNFSNPSWAEDPSQYLQSAYIPTAGRKDAVISVHSGVRIGAKHEIGLDVSKSFGSFQSLSATNRQEYNKSALGGVLSNEGRSNYALAFDYRGKLLNTDVQALFKNAGLGYNNPGNMFMRRGETQIQLGIGRRFFKQRLSLKYKADYRNQHFDPEKKITYITFSNKLNSSWKIKRNSRIGIGYQHSSYTSRLFMMPAFKGGSTIIQGDGTYRIKIAHTTITNTEIVTCQRMLLPSLAGQIYKSSSVFLAHTTMVPVMKNFATVSVMLNQSNNTGYYFNTSFLHTEANYSFTLNDKVQLVSGLGYYMNESWNRQVGVKQQLAFTASRNILIDIGIDFKRAVKVIRPELANPIFVNMSASYRL